MYPNPADPLNAEAAALNQKNESKYRERVSKILAKNLFINSFIGKRVC